VIDTVIAAVWNQVLARARREIGERAFETWLERSNLLQLRRGVLQIGVPNLFIKDWIEEHHSELLARLASEELGTAVRIQVRVDPALFREMRTRTERMEDLSGGNLASPEGKGLDSFLPTRGSQAALAALRHVLDPSARPALSPLVIHGPEGSGKSHLASALPGLAGPGRRIKRLAGEALGRLYAMSVKSHRADELRAALAGEEVLVVDDVQDLARKLATQRECLLLAGDLHARGGSLILFSRLHPGEIPDLEPGFRSFLLSGHLIALDPPGGHERLLVVEAMLRSSGRRFPPEVVRLVLERLQEANVVDAARAIRKLYALAGLTGEPVDAAFLNSHLAEVTGPTDPKDRCFEGILRAVSSHFGVHRDELIARRKTRILARPRAIAVYLLRARGSFTFKEIGRRLGQRSHTSIFIAHQKLALELARDPALAGAVDAIARRAGA
jgi:chromosomal replication initiator protein